ncbi:MAG: YidC/Oxa1 family membrane protein insertase, partial [bacterium]
YRQISTIVPLDMDIFYSKANQKGSVYQKILDQIPEDVMKKIDALKIKYKDQKELMAQELMKLYKEEKINPLSSCFPLLVQIPFFIAIYQVFAAGLSSKTALVLYPFVANPGTLNHIAFGFLNLGTPNWFLAVLAGAAQFWQAKMMPMQKPAIGGDGSKDENMAVMVNKQMTYFMPIMTLFIGLSLPGGLMLYWCVNSLFAVAQQKIAFRKRKELTVQVIDKK